MKIKLIDLTVRELVDGYHDDGQDGVRGYGGVLDIRPPFQREFIYGAKERNAVIDSILKGFPLNVMYWSDREDGTYEIIDGQQRTISIAQYVAEKPGFSFEGLGIDNQQSDIKEKILNYELMVYVCSGAGSEKLAWFKVINIAGVKLSDQELRNAVYAGRWVSDAKRYFSRRGSAAAGVGAEYIVKMTSLGHARATLGMHRAVAAVGDWMVAGVVNYLNHRGRRDRSGQRGFMACWLRPRQFDPGRVHITRICICRCALAKTPR